MNYFDGLVGLNFNRLLDVKGKTNRELHLIYKKEYIVFKRQIDRKGKITNIYK